ncbi:TPA: hypothetical protein N0F65_002659 [Lagenidium giganteum]|uniref:RBR-type E3 ubiquitin transferase n=1 Tax=Lagenidium giganteum TaxID=4803 RepID=A0AAV2Z6N6_9STRA|nr:TPA: hypothetical protein N0F65_002659 [Lagenidium giganteum]
MTHQTAVDALLDDVARPSWASDSSDQQTQWTALDVEADGAARHYLLTQVVSRLNADVDALNHAAGWTWLLQQVQHLPVVPKSEDARLLAQIQSLSARPLLPGAVVDVVDIVIDELNVAEREQSLSQASRPSASQWPRLSVTPTPTPTASHDGWGRESGVAYAPMALSPRSSFALSISSYLTVAMEDTFYCFICFEHVPQAQGFHLSSCGHCFCRPCLVMYLENKINDGQVLPACFYEDDDGDTCGAEVALEDIHAVVSADSWAKYNRFKLQRQHHDARQCPSCGHAEVYPDGDVNPACECPVCHATFCFFHSNAHVGKTCTKYEKRLLKAEKLNRALISKIAKPCPGCNHPVEKSGGCNHMRCIACQTHFCWLCGAQVENTTFPDHFKWWNVAGCPGAQMTATDPEHLNVSWTSRILRGFYIIVLGLPVSVLALMSTILSWPFERFRRSVDGDFGAGIRWWMQRWMCAVMLPIGIAVAIVVLPVLGVIIAKDEITRGARDSWACLGRLVIDASEFPCAGCGQPLQISDGDTHTKCQACTTINCRRCQREGDTIDHRFEWWNVRACRVRRINRGCVAPAIDVVWLGAIIVIGAAPATVMTLVMWPWASCRTYFHFKFTVAFNWSLRKIMSVVAAIFLGVCMVVGAVCMLLALPIRALRRIWQAVRALREELRRPRGAEMTVDAMLRVLWLSIVTS